LAVIYKTIKHADLKRYHFRVVSRIAARPLLVIACVVLAGCADPLLDIADVTRIKGVAIGGVWLDEPSLGAAAELPVQEGFEYPRARRGNVVDRFHGVDVSDPYRWMEDLLNPELESWIEAQNRLSEPILTRDALYTESIARLTAIADLYPTQEPGREAGGRTFFLAFVGSTVQLLVRSPDASEARVLLDDAVLGKGATLQAYMPSPDGRYVAYVVGPAGADWGEIRIHDVVENRTLTNVLPNVRFAGPFDWTADGQGLVYRRFAPPQGGRREAPAKDPALYLHRIASPLADDLLLYALPGDQSDWSLSFGLHNTSQQMFIYIERGPWNDGNLGGSRAQVQVLELDRSGRPLGDAAPRVLTEAVAAYRVVHAEGGHAWVYTNKGAPRRRVVLMDLAQPAPEHWRTLVPEGSGVLSHVAWFGGRMVVHSMENVHSVVRVYDAQGQQIREIPLPGTGVVQGMWGSASSLRVSLLYSGLLQAPVMLSHDIERGTTEIGVGEPGAPDLSVFEVVQDWVTSKDGTRVPVFVASRRGLVRDGSHPTIIYGYGASGTSVLPFFREDVVAWLQMGGVYAIANLRGGGEFGDAWYEAAIREHKQTTFDDLIAASEHLIKKGWTSPRGLAISGGSNGGLLVTATMLQRPDLFRAVLADVPVTDVLRRHLSGNGMQQIDQWGTPDDPAVFPAMHAYSPLHNVVPGTCYPATLVTTSRDDDRLPPWHAYKFTAALQAAQGCPAPVLLYVRSSGGHGGGDLDGWIESVAQQFVFLSRQLDVLFQPYKDF
jgi:prolyl oligopeptidase